jgi:hypothetical protein
MVISENLGALEQTVGMVLEELRTMDVYIVPQAAG